MDWTTLNKHNKSDSTISHVRSWYEIATLNGKRSLNQFTTVAKFHTFSARKKEGGSILIFTKYLGFCRYYTDNY